MSLGVLFVGTMFVCLLGLITGGPLEEERKRYGVMMILIKVYVHLPLITC